MRKFQVFGPNGQFYGQFTGEEPDKVAIDVITYLQQKYHIDPNFQFILREQCKTRPKNKPRSYIGYQEKIDE